MASARHDPGAAERGEDAVQLGLQVGEIVVDRRDDVGGDIVAEGVGIRRRVGRNRHGRHGVVGGADCAGQIGDGGGLRPGIADDLAAGLQLDDTAGLDDQPVAVAVEDPAGARTSVRNG